MLTWLFTKSKRDSHPIIKIPSWLVWSSKANMILNRLFANKGLHKHKQRGGQLYFIEVPSLQTISKVHIVRKPISYGKK